GGEVARAAGARLLADLADVPDPVVVGGAPDVEGLRPHRLGRRLEDSEEGAGDVLDVDDGTPGRPVALEEDFARSERPGDEVVEHDVEAEPGRNAVSGGAAEEGGGEGTIGEPGDAGLG